MITLYAYNLKGELEYTAVDLNQNDTIDFTGTDRITRTVRDYGTYLSYDTRRTYTYALFTNSSATETQVAFRATSHDGLRSFSQPTGQSAAATAVTAYGASGARTNTVTGADGAQTVSIYSYGRLVSVTRKDSGGGQVGQTSYGYDSHGRVGIMTDARNGTSTNLYNAADQITTVSTPAPGGGYLSQTTITSYDNMGRAWKVTLPDGTSTTNLFYLTGQLQKTSGSRTYPVEYTYDSQGRMQTMKTWQSVSGGTTAITTWNYDSARGWLASKDYADATTGNAGTTGNDYLYSDAGRLRTNQLARTVSGGARLQRVYTYGTGGDLSGIAYNDSGATPGVTFTYDRLGRRLTAARGSMTSMFHYTTASLPLGESHSAGTLGGWAVTNTFDGNLRRATVAATLSGAAQLTQSYGYDTAGRLQTATSGSFSAEYGYHANSPLVSTVSHRYGGNNRMVTTKQYDFINRLSSIANGTGDSHAYGYNNANQRTNVVRADGSYWIYTYDNLGQVISGKRYWSDGTPVAGQQHEYVFDDIGNRTSAKSGGNSSGTGLRTENYTRNRLNQYTQKDEAATFDVLGLANASATVTVNGSSAYRKNEYFHKEVSVSNGSAPVWQAVSTIASLGGSTTTNTGNMYVAKTPEVLTYDLDGNQLTDGRWSNTWDAENRLAIQETIGTVPTGAKKRLIYEYDWMGRRIRKQVYDWVSSAWSLVKDERFLYDGWNVVAIMDSATTIQQTQLWGKDLSGSLQGAGGVGGLLALTHYASSKTYFAGYDGNGNVTVLVDGVSGLTEGNFEYGPFGELIRASGTAVAVCPWRFSTKYEDAETGMLYYGYRFYNPSTGRWLSRDPIEESGGLNLYAFVVNDSIRLIDVLGQTIPGMSASAYAPYRCCPKIEISYDLSGDNGFGNWLHVRPWTTARYGGLGDAAEDAKKRVTDFDPDPSKCRCISHLIIVSHGGEGTATGQITFPEKADNIFIAQLGRTEEERQKNFEKQRGVQKMKELAGLMCSDGKITFTACFANDPDGDMLRQLKAAFGGVNIDLKAGLGGMCFGIPIGK